MRRVSSIIALFGLLVVNGCGFHHARRQNDRMLRGILIGMDRKTVTQMTGGDPLPRIAGSLPDGTVLRIDEVGLFNPGTYTFYWIGGVLTASVLWWFNPAEMAIFGTIYWFQYQNDALIRWGQRSDFLPNVKGDIVIRQNPVVEPNSIAPALPPNNPRD